MKFAHVAALAAFVLLLVVLPSLCEPEKVDVRETMHEKLIELLDAHDVVVITKATCPYCKKAKSALRKAGIKFYTYELDAQTDRNLARDIHEAAFRWTGQRTVPNIFVKAQHVGGSDKLDVVLANGEFQKLLDGPRPPRESLQYEKKDMQKPRAPPQ